MGSCIALWAIQIILVCNDLTGIPKWNENGNENEIHDIATIMLFLPAAFGPFSKGLGFDEIRVDLTYTSMSLLMAFFAWRITKCASYYHPYSWVYLVAPILIELITIYQYLLSEKK